MKSTPLSLLLEPGQPHALARAVSDNFARVYGKPPDAVAYAPGRVNVIGEHTDYSGGWALPIALPHATYVAARRRPDRRVTIRSSAEAEPFVCHLDHIKPTNLSGWCAYVGGTLWALEESGVSLPGMDVLIETRVPVGAGLSSSAALECSLAIAACSVAGITVDDRLRRGLVSVCVRAEHEAAGAPTGGMDQSVSLLAKPGHALLLNFSTWRHQQVPWTFPGVSILVVDTRVKHALGDGQYAERRRQCEQVQDILGVAALGDVLDYGYALGRIKDPTLYERARHVFNENLRVAGAIRAINQGDAVELGRILVESHESLRDDYEVSCPELDTVVDLAKSGGAYGARMTGGGFGGSAIVLVNDAEVADVALTIRAEFALNGFDIPGFLLATPSAGANVVAPVVTQRPT